MNNKKIPFDINTIRKEFPILEEKVNGKPLIYFDNAATSQKPKVVIDALTNYYYHTNSNIHRGAHYLAAKATEEYEQTREAIREFLNAQYPEEIIFTRGVTEAINLIASTYGRQNIKEGDEIILSTMEHHSNIVPWQMLAEEKGAIIKVIPVTDEGELMLEEYAQLLSPKTKIVSLVHVSNSLGTINPIKVIIEKAHKAGAVTVIDGAQASVHLDIDVQDLDCDFYAFSGHKVYAPTGIGALYGKKEILEAMPPYHGGGEMIKDVSFEKTTYNELPFKFEAGTPNIADAIAFKNALSFISQFEQDTIQNHEKELLHYATQKLENIQGVKIIGTTSEKISVISFIIEGLHHGDIGSLLDVKGIAVRTGHHCTQPLMTHFEISGTTRISFALYNTKEEIDHFINSLEKVIEMLQ